MKKLALNVAMVFGCAIIGFSQSKPTIAVANPSVNELYITPIIASKLIQLELIKLNIYSVYDEFDMEDAYEKDPKFENNCLSKSCLAQLGTELDVNYMLLGSFDALGNKIVIKLKIIDVKNGTIYKLGIREFDNQEVELQRMTEILLKEIHGIEVDKETNERLMFQNEPITSTNVGKVRNSGPRVGYGLMTGTFHEFATRPEDQGGLDIFPGVSMIGYQFEAQYVGTENFSALVEGIANISGLEQGQFIPTFTLMNGFRFGKSGWEFAFGPGIGFKKVSKGFFDTEGRFGDKGDYISSNDWNEYTDKEYNNIEAYPEYFSNGFFEAPDPEAFYKEYNLDSKHADKRGETVVSTSFLFAFGRTFRSGALNIPVNVFYSSKKGGGLVGINVGFNVMKSKKPINPKIKI